MDARPMEDTSATNDDINAKDTDEALDTINRGDIAAEGDTSKEDVEQETTMKYIRGIRRCY